MSNYTKNKLIDQDKNTAWTQVLSLIGSGWTILDIGCSSGNLGKELIDKKQAIVDGIDIDDADVTLARQKLRKAEVINVETATELTAIFKDKYDAILFIDVIEHLVDPVAALKKVKSLLKPEGVVIFSIPNMSHVSVRLSLLEGDFTYTQTGLLDKTHLHFYTGKEVQRVFSEAQYRIDNFSCSSLQYPTTLIKERLASIGIEGQKDFSKFISMLEETKGFVYQYVGSAKPDTSKTKNSQQVPKLNAHEKDYKIIEQIIEDQKLHIKNLTEERKLKDQHIKNLEKIIEFKNLPVAKKIKRKLKHKS